MTTILPRMSMRVIMAMAIGATLLVLPANPASAQYPGCSMDGYYDDGISSVVGAGNRPTADLQRFETYSRNYIFSAHCYNDHYHAVHYYDSYWKWGASAMCAQWSTGGQFHQDWGSAGSTYQCWLEWNVASERWWKSDADMWSVLSRHHLSRPGWYDFDDAYPNDCWKRDSSGNWTSKSTC